MCAIGIPEIDFPHIAALDGRPAFVEPTGRQTEIHGKDIHGPGRQQPKHHISPPRIGQAIDHFVDGAVTTSGHHQRFAGRRQLRGHLPRIPGGPRRMQHDTRTQCLQFVHTRLGPCAPGTRIENHGYGSVCGQNLGRIGN